MSPTPVHHVNLLDPKLLAQKQSKAIISISREHWDLILWSSSSNVRFPLNLTCSTCTTPWPSTSSPSGTHRFSPLNTEATWPRDHCQQWHPYRARQKKLALLADASAKVLTPPSCKQTLNCMQVLFYMYKYICFWNRSVKWVIWRRKTLVLKKKYF